MKTLPPGLQQEISYQISKAYVNSLKKRPVWLTMVHSILALILTWIIYAIPAFIVMFSVTPLYYILPFQHYMVGSFLCYVMWNLTSFLFDRHGMCVSSSGDTNIPNGESAFVIANHVFFGDFFPVAYLARKKGMLGFIRHFVKHQVFRVPLFGWGMYLNSFPGLKREWGSDKDKLRKSIGRIIENKFPIWLVSHVEGTRYNAQAAAKSLEFTESQGMEPLQHVILPRYKGFWVTSLAIRDSHINYIYDITMAYYHEKRGFGCAPTVWDIFVGQLHEFHTHVHIERIPLASVPTDESQCAKWIYDRFYRKDALMEEIKRNFEEQKLKWLHKQKAC